MRKALICRSLLALAIAANFSSSASAQDGSWNVVSNGNWNDTANWAGGIPASGTGFTATFANDITADLTVTLTAPQTIGNLVFGDADTATAGSWILTNGGTAANILTLDATTPTLTVNSLGTGKSATINAVIAGSAGLVKDGNGLLVLGADNTYTGGTAINNGTLRISNTNQLEGATSIASLGTLNWQLTNSTQTLANAITGTGILQVDLIGATVANSTASGLSGFSGTVRISAPSGTPGNKLQITGGAANADIIVDSGAQFFAANAGTYKSLSLVGTGNSETRGAMRITTAITVTNGVTLTGNTTIGTEGGTLNGSIQGTAATATTQTLTFGSTNSTGSMTINGAISDGTAGGTLAVTKTQAGTLTLNGNNTYTGATTVSAGRVNPTGTNTSAMTFASGTTLGSSGTGSTTGALTLNAGANVALAGGATLTGFTANSVNVAGATNINFDTAAVVGNTYTVFNYTGSLTGFANIQPYTTGHSTLTNTGSAVTLTYLGAGATSTWNTTTGNWDLATANWTNTLDNKYGNGDAVIFNNPSAPSTVTVSGTVTPSRVTINNSTNAYTFGTGIIGGTGPLYKTGTGTVTLNGANTYSGGTTLSQGSINLGNATAVGSGLIILGDSNTGSNNLTLNQSSTATVANSILVSPWGSGTVTISSNSNTTTPTFSGAVTLNRPTTFSYTGTDRLHFSGTINGNVGTLTIAGGKRTTTQATASFQGDVLVTGSGTILQTGVASAAVNAIPDWSNVTVDAGATWNFSYTGSGTETINALHGAGNIGVNAAVTDTLIVGAYNGTGSFTGAMSGGANLGLTKLGSGTQTLAPAATYTSTGRTSANGGTLALSFGGGLTTNLLATTSALTLGGGTLQLTGANTASQTVNGLTTTAITGSRILLDANKTLTLGALTSAGANSAVNFNTAAGGADAATSTLGTSLIKLTGQTAGNVINTGFTVTDSTGFGLATVDASTNVVRLTTATLLPATGSVSTTDYRIDNNAGGVSADGSSTLTISASQATNSITVDTTTASGTLTLDSGVTLSNNIWNFGGTGTNTYNITGGTGITSVASAGTIAFNNYNSGNVTITSPIIANGVNPVIFAGTGTTILDGTSTYTGATTISGGTVQVGPGATLNGLATTGAINVGSTVTINSGAKLVYNRIGQTNILAGSGAVEYYGNNIGTTGGSTAASFALNNGSTAFSGTMLISGIRAIVDNAGDVGSAQITVLPTGQLYVGAQTLSNNIVLSGTGWGETAGLFGAMRLDGSTLNGAITLAADARIGNANATAIINGIIGEIGGSRKLQVGGGNTATYSTTLTLNAANAYTGGTDIGSSTSTANTVNVGNNSAFSSGPVNALSNATVASAGAARTIANPFTVASGKTLSFSGAGGLFTINGLVSGAGNVGVTAGNVLLTGNNAYTGTTTVNGSGTMQIAGTTNTGAGTVNVGSTTVGTLTILNGGSLTTTGALNLGSGVVGHTLNINAGGSLSVGSIANPWQSTYNIDGTLTSAGAWSISTNSTSNINGAASGVISAASLTTGNGSTIVNYNSLGTMNLTGNLSLAVTGTGAVNINAGTVNIGGVTWGGGIQTLSLAGGRLNVGAAGIAATGGSSRTVNFGNAIVGARADWTGAQDIALNGTAAGTTFNTLDSVDNTTARTITLSGILSGTGKLVKEGTGTLTLSNTGNQTYAGTTTVNAGTMIVAGTLANNGVASILMAAPDDTISGNPILTRAIATGLNAYAGLGSSVTAASLDPVLNVGLQTQASILMSGNNAVANNMTMQWRTRTTGEAAGSNPNAVLSDVLNLSDMGSDLFVMQMSYTDAALTHLGLNESSIAISGELRLGWNDGGVWKSAFAGNSVPTGTFAGAISWSTFVSNNGVALDGSNLGSYLGAYGVDPTTNVVWAVLDHNSEFAVIPEPSTMVFGGFALLGLAGVGLRRRRLAK